MKPSLKTAFWVGLYLLLVLAPLFALLIGPRPRGLGFWTDLSLALGFSGAAMMAIQFLLTARFRRATAPFGVDIIYYFHRYVAYVALAFILAHPLLLALTRPEFRERLNPLRAEWAILTGEISIAALVLLCVTSIWRKQLRVPYDGWRRAHVVLAAAALLGAVLHIEGSAYYLTLPQKRILWTLILVSWVGVLLNVRLVKPLALLRRPWEVVERRRERGDVWTLVLEARGHPGIRFEPGQFAWLSLGSTPFAMREHPFSIASSPTDPTRVLLSIKELGDFTRNIRSIEPGERAWLDGPHGAFTIDRESAPGVLFVAGGIGIAPVMSMLRALRDRGDERPLVLIYGNRRWERVAFREELEELASGPLNLRVVHVLEEPPEGWAGERGRPDRGLLERTLPPNHRELACFVCGPTAMIAAVERSLHALGVPLARIHSELFDLV